MWQLIWHGSVAVDLGIGGSTLVALESIMKIPRKVKKKIDDWAKHHYYCQKHIPKAQAVGWDKIQQKEVVEKQPNKRETLKKIITEKKKFCEKQQKVILPL